MFCHHRGNVNINIGIEDSVYYSIQFSNTAVLERSSIALTTDKFSAGLKPGTPKPAGLERTYPNMITRERVLGSEHNIWSEKATPEQDLLIPFIRMLPGTMDCLIT